MNLKFTTDEMYLGCIRDVSHINQYCPNYTGKAACLLPWDHTLEQAHHKLWCYRSEGTAGEMNILDCEPVQDPLVLSQIKTIFLLYTVKNTRTFSSLRESRQRRTKITWLSWVVNPWQQFSPFVHKLQRVWDMSWVSFKSLSDYSSSVPHCYMLQGNTNTV